MANRTVAALGALSVLLGGSLLELAQAQTADPSPPADLIRFPGIKTVTVDLPGEAASSFKLPIQYGDHGPWQ